MIRKMIYQLISVCLLFGALVSCSSEDELKKSASDIGISLELKTTGQTRSSVEPGTEAERQISAASVWFFGTGAGAVDKAVLYKKITSLSSTGSLTLNFTDEELRLHNMSSEGIYEIFVVANLPADAGIDEQTTLANLKGYSYTATTRPGSPFCMAGNSVGVHDFGKNSQLSIPLLRAASRLDITVKNTTGKAWSINKISIAEDQKSVLLFAPVTGSAAPASDAFKTAQDIPTTATTNDEVTCSWYIYENRSTSSVKVIIEGTVDGTAKTWTSELKPNGSATLPRNTICGVTLNLKESMPVVPSDISFTIKEWTTEQLDTSIPGTYLDVDKSNIGVLYMQGASLLVNSDANVIHVDLSNAPGFYLSGHEGKQLVEIAISDESAVLLFHFQGHSDITIPDGVVAITSGNLRKKVNLIKKNSTMIFNPVSLVICGRTIKDGDVVPGDFWGSLNSEEPYFLTVYSNFTWAYTLKGHSEIAGGEVIDSYGRSEFNGIVGESGPDLVGGIQKTLTVFNASSGGSFVLPIEMTLTFYVNNYLPPYNGVVLETFHFTLADI